MAAFASQERYLPWSEVHVRSPGVADTGAVSFTAKVGNDDEWHAVEIEAFGEKYTLDERQRAGLKGYPARSLIITYDPGYEHLGGHSVHFKFKRLRRDGDRLREREIVVSISKGKGLAIQERDEKPAESADQAAGRAAESTKLDLAGYTVAVSSDPRGEESWVAHSKPSEVSRYALTNETLDRPLLLTILRYPGDAEAKKAYELSWSARPQAPRKVTARGWDAAHGWPTDMYLLEGKNLVRLYQLPPDFSAEQMDKLLEALADNIAKAEPANEADDVHVMTDTGHRTISGKQAEAYHATNVWLEARLQEVESIRVGSSYGDVAKHFRRDGGIAELTKHRFVSILCPFLKIDMEFEEKDSVNAGQPLTATAKVVSVSKPYFERAFAD